MCYTPAQMQKPTQTQNILNWYKKFGRKNLPWRNTTDAYHIYLSEIMLQQTQVKTVLERFYFQFLKKFPTIQSLANAKQDDVLKAWEGLGYYTRARNLHKTATIVQIALPKTAKELEELPGIGKSTANAIACFAYNEANPILDANVKRILYRYYKKEKCNEKELWELSHKLFIKEEAYDFNQAMMDLGALVCTSRNPQCNLCPLEKNCQGKDEPHKYPTKKKKKKKPIKERDIIVFQYNNHFALFKNDTKLLGGLWAFKQYESYDNKTIKLGQIKQVYSHFTLKATIYLEKVTNKEGDNWFSLEEISNLALSGADKKVLALIDKK